MLFLVSYLIIISESFVLILYGSPSDNLKAGVTHSYVAVLIMYVCYHIDGKAQFNKLFSSLLLLLCPL